MFTIFFQFSYACVAIATNQPTATWSSTFRRHQLACPCTLFATRSLIFRYSRLKCRASRKKQSSKELPPLSKVVIVIRMSCSLNGLSNLPSLGSAMDGTTSSCNKLIRGLRKLVVKVINVHIWPIIAYINSFILARNLEFNRLIMS